MTGQRKWLLGRSSRFRPLKNLKNPSKNLLPDWAGHRGACYPCKHLVFLPIEMPLPKTLEQEAQVRIYSGRALVVPAFFWRHVQLGVDADCWRWTGHRSASGCGVYCVCRIESNGLWHHRQRMLRAHLVAYELEVGPVTGEVCHRCDTRCDTLLCCNPEHLCDGKRSYNTGERHPRAKLTAADVLAIRQARAAGTTLKVLAARYGLAHSTLSMLTQGKTWRDL
jgi:hypothetical protein